MDEEKLKRIFAAHPLSVELAITLDADSTIKVQFDYIITLCAVSSYLGLCLCFLRSSRFLAWL